jgi:hypothetical protein
MIQLDKEQAIMVREPDATMQLAPQDIQLVSKHRVLSFKPQLRLEWQGQDGQKETEQPDHFASLSDFTTSSTRIRFSVHTTVTSILHHHRAAAMGLKEIRRRVKRVGSDVEITRAVSQDVLRRETASGRFRRAWSRACLAT